MMLPTAMIVAVHAVKQEVESARPDAPALADPPPRPPRFARTRRTVSRGLYAAARSVAPREVHPARCATGLS